jgi:diacylglycerol kinase family enzyme
MQLTLIYNLGAGNGEQERADLEQRLRKLGYRVRSQSRKSPGFPSALAEPADLVVVAGGDGTVAKIIKKLPDWRIPVTILPLGIANNIARSFGIAGSIEELAAGWRRGAVRRLDLFEAGGTWGRKRILEAIGFGALTKGMMQSRGLEGSREEKLAAARANIMNALKRATPKSWRVELDGKTVAGEFLFVEVMSMSHMGPGIWLNPDGDPGDGMLDVITIGARQRKEMIDWLERGDGSRPPVESRKVRTVDVAWHRAPLRVDDEFHDSPRHMTRVHAEYFGQFARILVPRTRAARKRKT